MGGAAAQPQCGAGKIRALQAAGLGSSQLPKKRQVQPHHILTKSYSEKPVTVTMIAKKMGRPEQIRALRRAGVSVGDICEQVGISRQTVWRHCRGLEPVPPAPTPDANGHASPLDLEAAQSVGLDVLVDKARTGSVSAAAHVFKIASAELRADKCQNHISKDAVIAALQAQYGLWRMHLQGAFVRRLLLEFDVDPARIESLVDDAIDGITRELNTRFAAEDNHG